MIFIKYIILFGIFGISTSIGFILSNKSKNRVIELKEFKKDLHIIKTKIKFTYEPLGEILKSLSQSTSENFSRIFLEAYQILKIENAKQAWEKAMLKNFEKLSINKEDQNIILGLGNMLGKTDIDGQINELELTLNFLDSQILKAEEERRKNEKMYKSLGSIVGLVLVIIFI